MPYSFDVFCSIWPGADPGKDPINQSSFFLPVKLYKMQHVHSMIHHNWETTK